MTSSFRLQKRFENADLWNFGAQSDHYIRPWGECHPDFTAIPIGHPHGVKVCVRRVREGGKPKCENNSVYNGTYGCSLNLYEPGAPPTQISNPTLLEYRKVPDEEYLKKNDYFRNEPFFVKEGGTGVQFNNASNRRYYPYDFKGGDPPPYKYDVTRLVQPYGRWRQQQIYSGYTDEELSKIDTHYDERVV